MKRSIPSVSAVLLASALHAASAQAPEVRFYPDRQIWAYELEAARKLNSVVLHNAAVVNRTSVPLVVEEVRLDVLRGDEVVLSKNLRRSDLDQMAKAGSGLHASGAMEALSFQFAPSRLLGPDTSVSDTRTLRRDEALYIPVQVLAFQGKPDRVQITVDFAGEVADAIAAVPVRYGSAEGRYRLPVEGRWVAGAGSTLHSHHRWAVPEEFAFDFVQFGASGSTHAGDGSRVTDFYAYGAAVLAAADGDVVAVLDTLPDNTEAMRRPGEALPNYQRRLLENQNALLAAGPEAIAGNHVIVRHGEGIYSVYGHLKPGSAAAKVGDRVVAGQPIGAVGSSGNSTEPHLHFHLCDAPELLQCVGIPVAFDNIEIPASERPRQIQSGDLVQTLPASLRDR